VKRVRTTDILIVGAGAIGSFTALNLAREGHKVTVIDRKVPGIEASGANAGSLGVQNKPFELGALAAESVDLWRDFELDTGSEAGYHRLGGFRVAETEDGVDRLRDLAPKFRSIGVNVEHIDGDEARRRAPYLSESVLAANFCDIDGHNNSLKAVPLVARAATSAGATIISGVEARSFQKTGDTFVVTTSDGEIMCDRLVITAGVWSRDILRDAGIHLPVALRNNQMMVTEPAPDFLNYIVFHIDGHLTIKQVHPALSCLIGGGWPGTGDFRAHQREVSYRSAIGNAALAIRVVPELANLRVLRSWSGFDWRTTDQMPVVGQIPNFPGLFICTSCYGGYTISPALARGLAKAVTTGLLSEQISQFSPEATVLRHEQHSEESHSVTT
jgi:glycine/D-amino acid oxidase-like deaminating enzyme